ncbi:hypothetical protein [Enterobacter ludwigii]|uniref:hypothetical protein n=1 Tax=Enterobacter ludwigii TaxID=299767 RepID=UPI002892DE68|nr:hypothetical protein [Enterobacter ludwigii]WNI83711.1 hypothetical protein RIK68_23975 [Enterobacter ludwigii]HBZ1698518.1 hypothetical protein [Salmonella enterica subsp. enterica serovar Enteritidis]
MKNELFKDPFVVLMISTRAITRQEDLERLITDEAYLCEQRDRLLNKECPCESIGRLVTIFRNPEWRRNNELSDILSVSLAKLAMLFSLDKDLKQCLSTSERIELFEGIRESVKQVNAIRNNWMLSSVGS